MKKVIVEVYTLDGPDDILTAGEVHKIRTTLNSGGICIVPSDTCYAVAVKPLWAGATELVDRVLDRNHTKISLSFGSQAMIERFVDLGIPEYRILDSLKRSQPVTIVAPISETLSPETRASLPRAVFSENGSLGVRLSGSIIERFLSNELDTPLTTAAINYPDGNPVRDFHDAVEIVSASLVRNSSHLLRNTSQKQFSVAAIRHPSVPMRALSTVVGISHSLDVTGVIIYRQGDVNRRLLENLAGTMTFRDVSEWT